MTVRDRRPLLPLQETEPEATQHIAKVQAEHDEQYRALRLRAQGLFTALKGRTGIRTPEEMEKLSEKSRVDYDSGAFLVERLGMSRFLDPELTYVLIRLRDNLLAEVERPTAAYKMHVDLAVLAYRNALRVQSLLNSALVETERQLFGQLSLDEVLGQAEASSVQRILEEVEQKLLPLLERCQRMMNRALDRLKVSDRPLMAGETKINVGFVNQVNIEGSKSE